VLTPDAAARQALGARLEQAVADGAFPAARVRVTSLVFGPPIPSPVAFRVTGPDRDVLRDIAARVRDVVAAEPSARHAYLSSGERAPNVRLAFDQDRLRLIGLTPTDAQRQVAALLSGVPVTQVREDIRSVDVVARALERGNLDDLDSLTLTTSDGRAVPLAGIARLVPDWEDPVLRRRSRNAYIEVRADVADGHQPPDVTAAILPQLEPIRASLPPGYEIVTGGTVEESAKANDALVAVAPVMLLLMLLVIMAQVRNFSLMWMTLLTAPLGVIGAAPTLLSSPNRSALSRSSGYRLAGILMRNTLILIEQIKVERAAGRAPREAVVEATVTRARPVLLTALAAMLAFVPLTFSSFWGPLAYVLIGGTAAGTILTLLFLPALHALWFRIGAPERKAGTGVRGGLRSLAWPRLRRASS
jgi:multidrug efflux pump subunit AcrB